MLKYWLWLTTRKGLGARGAYLVIRHFGSPEAAYFADPSAYRAVEGLRGCSPLLNKDLSEPERILSTCYEKGIGILTYQDAAYPERLRNIDDPPLVLYYRGTLPDLNGLCIAVVGTRTVSPYGMVQADKMGYGLSACGATVVSGGAKGVDGAAMKGALAGGSPVVAVLGSGVDVLYPTANKRLFEKVIESGCVLSEYPPGTEPLGRHFPVRNRIITGLSLGVLVVEAPERSGALVTANRALDQGRDVFTIPANLDSISCKGNLKLLRDGAIMVRDAWDVMQEYVHLYPERIRRVACKPLLREPQQQEQIVTVAQEEPKPTVVATGEAVLAKIRRLQGDERALADLLQAGPMHVDMMVEQTQMPVGRALASLTLLEVKGIIRRCGSKHFELVPDVL